MSFPRRREFRFLLSSEFSFRLSATYFLLLVQEKVGKEKHTPGIAPPLRYGVPCAARRPRVRRSAEQGPRVAGMRPRRRTWSRGEEGTPMSRSRVASKRVALGNLLRRTRDLRSSPVLRRAQTVLAETSECGCAARRRPRRPNIAKFKSKPMVCCWGSPLVTPRSARSLGAFREDCLSCERSEDGEFRSGRGD